MSLQPQESISQVIKSSFPRVASILPVARALISLERLETFLSRKLNFAGSCYLRYQTL
ncbi:hypothetical protein N665_0061s0024 [Sinapis alba]|nr:hypothetical protein N665_0061s0024 [Sinapis alba]